MRRTFAQTGPMLALFGGLALVACGDSEPSLVPNRTEPHDRLLAEYAARAPIPSGPWKGIGESSPKRLALVARERELLAEARKAPSAITHRMLGSLYTTVGESLRGLAYLSDSLLLNPDDGEAWTWLGANRLDRGEFTEAEILLVHALELSAEDVHALTYLGVTRMRAGNQAGARNAFERAISKSPEHAEALVPLAGLLEDEEQFELAREHLLVAYRVRPDDSPTLFRLARVSDELGLIEEARDFRLQHERIRVLDDLGLLHAVIPEAQRRASLGIYYLAQDRGEEALREFEAALILDPEPNVRINAVLGRAWCLVELNRVSEATAAILDFRALQPDHVELALLETRLAELQADE